MKPPQKRLTPNKSKKRSQSSSKLILTTIIIINLVLLAAIILINVRNESLKKDIIIQQSINSSYIGDFSGAWKEISLGSTDATDAEPTLASFTLNLSQAGNTIVGKICSIRMVAGRNDCPQIGLSIQGTISGNKAAIDFYSDFAGDWGKADLILKPNNQLKWRIIQYPDSPENIMPPYSLLQKDFSSEVTSENENNLPNSNVDDSATEDIRLTALSPIELTKIRETLEKNVKLKSFNVVKSTDKFVRVNVKYLEGDANDYILAKINDEWKIVTTDGQAIPNCAPIDQYQVPRQFYRTCWTENDNPRQ